MNEEIHLYIRGLEHMNVPGLKVHYYIDSYGRMWTHDPDYCMGCRSDALARNEARRYHGYMSTQPDLGE